MFRSIMLWYVNDSVSIMSGVSVVTNADKPIVNIFAPNMNPCCPISMLRQRCRKFYARSKHSYPFHAYSIVLTKEVDRESDSYVCKALAANIQTYVA